jgi:hypothetical protein
MRVNSRFLTGIAIIAVMAWGVSACLTPPTFPDTPSVGYQSVTFQKGEGNLDADTLALTLTFQDGNGDLGLNKDLDTGQPYNDLFFYLKPDGTILRLADRNTAPYDTLPPFEFPYYCTNYVIEESDTFYVEQNAFHYNIYVKFFVKKNGVYTEFDWVTEFDPICGESFNGRYPLLGNPNRDKPLEGKLKYKMASAGFELLFREDTLKLETYIYDRALNKSNTVETPDFVLKNITLGG